MQAQMLEFSEDSGKLQVLKSKPASMVRCGSVSGILTWDQCKSGLAFCSCWDGHDRDLGREASTCGPADGLCFPKCFYTYHLMGSSMLPSSPGRVDILLALQMAEAKALTKGLLVEAGVSLGFLIPNWSRRRNRKWKDSPRSTSALNLLNWISVAHNYPTAVYVRWIGLEERGSQAFSGGQHR